MLITAFIIFLEKCKIIYMENQFRYNFVLIVCLVCFFLLLNCHSEEKTSIVLNSLKVESIEYLRKTGDCEDDFSKTCALIRIVFPKITFDEDKDVENSINNYTMKILLEPVFDEKDLESIEAKMDNFINEYSNFAREFPEAIQQWEYEIVGSVKTLEDNFLCLEYSSYSYLGGAHPNSTTFYANFNLITGKKINLDDLFIKNYFHELNNIAEVEFRRFNRLNEDDDLDEAGFWFDNNRFKLNDNYALTAEGIIFYYNNYEIAPYVFGPSELTIPYEKIFHIIKKDSPISQFIE